MKLHDVIARLRSGKKGDEGFTLIELLVVVVIIGVLVAIAVPVYLNYRQGAADKSAQSDVRGAISAIEQFYTENGNKYPTGTLTEDNAEGDSPSLPLAAGADAKVITLSDKTELTYVAGTGADLGTYRICATNSGGSGKVYLYDSKAGGSVKESEVDVATCQ